MALFREDRTKKRGESIAERKSVSGAGRETFSATKGKLRAGRPAEKKEGALRRPEKGTEVSGGVAKPTSQRMGRSGKSRQARALRGILAKYLSHFKDTRLLVKKTLRNVIFYTASVLCLYPLLVFKHKVLIVLYLFLWTNIAIAVAAFLDELFDLPRKVPGSKDDRKAKK